MTDRRPFQADSSTQSQCPALDIPFTATSPARDQSAALKGASRAFVKPPVKKKTLVNTYSGTNGALAAATRANNIRIASTPATQSAIAPPAANRGRGDAGPGNAPLSAAQQSFDRDQAARVVARPRSSTSIRVSRDEIPGTSTPPSNIAATLAAARSTPQHSDHNISQPARSPNGARLSPMNINPSSDVVHLPGTMNNAMQDALNAHRSSRGQSTSSGKQRSMTPSVDSDDPTDASSIAPTKALIGLYEKDNPNVEPKRRTTKPSVKSPSVLPIIQSPRPLRPSSSSTPLTTAILATSTATSAIAGTSEVRPTLPGESPYGGFNRSKDIQEAVGSSTFLQRRYARPGSSDVGMSSLTPAEEHPKATEGAIDPNLKLKVVRPELPPPRKCRKSGTTSVRLRKASVTESDISSASSYVSAPELRVKPRTPPPRRKQLRQETGRSVSATESPPLSHSSSNPGMSNNTLKSFKGKQAMSSQLYSSPVTHSWMNDLPASDMEERWIRQPTQRWTPRLDESSLADAIVASSLASSRAPSPSKPHGPPPLPKRHHNLLQHHRHKSSRTPSPVRGMRQTMRKPPKSEDENLDDPAAQRRGRRNPIKKAPNKHHEGNRKRWRDEITERERKRYEGVWAANRGLHILFTKEESKLSGRSGEGIGKDDVSNIVVRDIWRRSRLEDTVLEEIWDLVDRRVIGRLTREEFVVGMWLIDQRLKGRKVPVKVSTSVWTSVRRLGDVKVPKHKT